MNNNFSATLLRLRQENKLSQKKAAADLGISQALLSHYEKGIRECGLDFVCRAAAYYGVSCDYLLGTEQKRTPVQVHFEPTDSEWTRETLFKAFSVLADSMNKSGSNEQIVKQYFTLSFYRLAAEAAASGELPKEWFHFSLDTAAQASKSVANHLTQRISPASRQARTYDEPLPECVKTVLQNAEQLIFEYLHHALNNFQP